MTECDCLLCQKRKLHPELATNALTESIIDRVQFGRVGSVDMCGHGIRSDSGLICERCTENPPQTFFTLEPTPAALQITGIEPSEHAKSLSIPREAMTEYALRVFDNTTELEMIDPATKAEWKRRLAESAVDSGYALPEYDGPPSPVKLAYDFADKFNIEAIGTALAARAETPFQKLLHETVDRAARQLHEIEQATGVRHELKPHPTEEYKMVFVPVRQPVTGWTWTDNNYSRYTEIHVGFDHRRLIGAKAARVQFEAADLMPLLHEVADKAAKEWAETHYNARVKLNPDVADVFVASPGAERERCAGCTLSVSHCCCEAKP